MKKVIITGASGFVGKNIIPNLEERGFECVPLTVRYGNKIDLPSDIFALIHLSGKAHDTSNKLEKEEYLQANYELTKTIYDACKEHQVKKFIYLSSVKAVADVVEGYLDENASCQPNTPYGISKLKAEQYITQNPMRDGQSYYILRPCMIHGPGNKGNLNLLYKFAKMGIPYPLAAFDNRRSFLSIENLNFVISELLERDNIPQGIYHIADDKPLATGQVMSIINFVLEKPDRSLKIPRGWIKILARFGDILRLPFNTSSLRKLTEDYVVSNKKIIFFLQKDLPVGAEEGLQRTIESFGDA
jgi:nucleoside-diphosphate-sugar epimerase